MQKSGSIRDYDWWLLATAFAICGVGVLEIWSATHASHLAGMHTHQIEWIALGFVLMLLVSRMDYHTIMDQAPLLYLIAIIALIAVLALGHARFGAKRWLPILGGFLQVSELVKLIIIIVLARFFADVRTEQLSLADLIKAAVVVGVPLGLIMLQPDLGTALVLVPLAAV
jgi:rod shape determining protein RodA